jgi:preprotein translocase subunit YajC
LSAELGIVRLVGLSALSEKFTVYRHTICADFIFLHHEDFQLFISEAFAQAGPAASGAPSLFGNLGTTLPFIAIFVVMYFVMIRPQMKRQKEAKAMVEALAKGDEVVIAGGVLGKISKLGDSFLYVEVANGVELQVQRASVVQVLPKGTFK